MRYYDLLNLRHVIAYFVSGLITVIIIWMSLSYSHFTGKDIEERKHRTLHRFAEDIEGQNAPFPAALSLIVAGAVVWGVLYILVVGFFEVKI